MAKHGRKVEGTAGSQLPAGSDRERPSPGSGAPKSGPPRMAAERMEEAILQQKIAVTHCPTCGAQGRFRIETTRGRIRYLICIACGVGRSQTVVVAAEVEAAIKAGSGPTK